MTDEKQTEKANEPELIEDSELDDAAGGEVARYNLKLAWPSKVGIVPAPGEDGD